MAAVKKRNTVNSGSFRRVSPMKPGLRGARNWASAQVRAAGHTRKGAVRFGLSVLAILFAVAFFALWIGGFLPQVKQGVSDFKKERLMAMGFVVEQIDVMGEGRLNEDDVRAVINIYPGDYFFGADLKSAQTRTESLPWVERAVVRRLWPNRIVVQLVEVEPYAVWQQNGKLSLVSMQGEAITDINSSPNMPAGLRIIVGEDAPIHAAAFQQVLKGYPEVWNRTESMVHLRGERWDVFLKNGIKVKLPEENVELAIQNLVSLHDGTQIMDREIGVIDLRLADRLTLSPKEEKDA